MLVVVGDFRLLKKSTHVAAAFAWFRGCNNFFRAPPTPFFHGGNGRATNRVSEKITNKKYVHLPGIVKEEPGETNDGQISWESARVRNNRTTYAGLLARRPSRGITEIPARFSPDNHRAIINDGIIICNKEAPAVLFHPFLIRIRLEKRNNCTSTNTSTSSSPFNRNVYVPVSHSN